MAKSWAEVKALLDDSSVPPDAKANLLGSWMRENPPPPPFLKDQEPEDLVEERNDADRYAKAYPVNPFVDGRSSTDDTYAEVKKASDQAGYNEDQEAKAVGDGKTQLDGLNPPASGGGTKTSDELFDAAEPALKLFQTFGSLLAKIPDDCRGNTRALDYDKDIKKPYDEQRGISFQDFVDDAGHFTTGADSVEQTIQNTGSTLSSLFQSWSGAGADAAWDNYNDQVLPKATKLGQTLGDAADATTTAVTAVFELCKGKADAIVGMYTDQVGCADFTMAQRVVAVASGEKAGDGDLAAIAGWMDLNFGTNLVQTLNDRGCCDGDEIRQHGVDLAKQWVQNQFNPDMWDRLYQGFVKTCEDARELTDQAYDALDDVMGRIRNEFGAASGGASPTGSGSPTGGGTGVNVPPIPDGTQPVPGGTQPVPGGTQPEPTAPPTTSGGSPSVGNIPPIPSATSPSGGSPGNSGGSPSGGGVNIPPIPTATSPSGDTPGMSGGSPSGGGVNMPSIPTATSPSRDTPVTSGGSPSGGGSGVNIPPIPDMTSPSGTTPSGSGGSPSGSGGGLNIPSIPSLTTPSGDTPGGSGGSPSEGKLPNGLGAGGGTPSGTGGDPAAIGGIPSLTDPSSPDGGQGVPGEDNDPPETLKVQQGDKNFEMTEPDADGHMDIKVGDGTGEPKDYKLDWSTAQDPAAGGAADQGPPGTDDVHHPGADGKIHIEDGDLKITAERPDGPDGPTKVTVDDGSGTPTTYTLGDADTPGHHDDPLASKPAGDPTGTKVGGADSAVGGGHGGNGSTDGHAVPAGADGAPAHAGTSGAHALGGHVAADGSGGASAAAAGIPGGGAHSGAAAFAPQDASGSSQQVAASGATGSSPTGMSGMGGMGAMGGGGAGGAGGGDQERARSYRIEAGGLFEFGAEPSHRITGSLDDEELPPVPRHR
ncbi:WXG100 family type VII secretion target [Amycolatopsis sp.]|uniref:WXG100 family type VII secretion target n=1 Tax=Amycolatopsis sp. TaxID=37632 RepID=UPI002E079B63|nr:WXG100 family type VII secretion target [Amycolatopsis sp.]